MCSRDVATPVLKQKRCQQQKHTSGEEEGAFVVRIAADRVAKSISLAKKHQ